MHSQHGVGWEHDHVFGHDEKRAGENRTLLIVVITAVMMVVEIAAGLIYGSMALLADGLHMGSHATALGIAFFAYVVSRRLAADRRFSFGVGKINSLAGFTSAVLLLGFALLMILESVERYINPQDIAFDQALIVAVIGLIVNGGSAVLLMTTPQHHSHGHRHGHSHHAHSHGHGHHHSGSGTHSSSSELAQGDDHNLKAAYLHVLADAVTSVFAIAALLAGKHYGANWLDPFMGIVGGVLVARWSVSLVRDTSRVLLDSQADAEMVNRLTGAIEAEGSDRVSDLHLWNIGEGLYALELAIVCDEPQPPDHYKALIPEDLAIAHSTIEVHQRPSR